MSAAALALVAVAASAHPQVSIGPALFQLFGTLAAVVWYVWATWEKAAPVAPHRRDRGWSTPVTLAVIAAIFLIVPVAAFFFARAVLS